MQTRSQTRNLMAKNNVTFAIESVPNTGCQTRSATKSQTILDTEFTDYDSSSDYDPDEEREPSVDIDFDEASTAWRQNKISLGNGTYTYIKNAFTEPKIRHAKIHPEINRPEIVASSRMVLRSHV